MFNFSSVNTAEVNAGSQAPLAPSLSILIAEDINTLSWDSPVYTDFFVLYWSDNPFTSIDEPGVHAIVESMPIPSTTLVSYTHTIPAAFSLRVLHYRVSAFNYHGYSLSNQVDSYNYKLAIYEDLYDATLEALTLRFTPELRLQYQDSILWKSFVEAICSELAQGRFEIKEALKQLNLQKAIDIFLNLWNNITGISKINVTNSTTGLLEPETDAQYRQRLVDNIFWDKISNIAMKKTLLLKLGLDADVVDSGASKAVLDAYSGASLNAKLLSNIYVVNLGSAIVLDDALGNTIYDEIFSLAALGNVLVSILQDVSANFEDWDIVLGNIPYGPIFVGAPSYAGAADAGLAGTIYMDNQWDMNDGKTFYGNDGPDDIVVITRTAP